MTDLFESLKVIRDIMQQSADGVCKLGPKTHVTVIIVVQIAVQTFMALINLALTKSPWIKANTISQLLINIPKWIFHRVFKEKKND